MSKDAEENAPGRFTAGPMSESMAMDSMTRMVIRHMPKPEVLQVLGEISIHHSLLDYMLVMSIKSLTSCTVNEARKATAFEGAAKLRKRVVTLARKRFGDGHALVCLQALMERFRQVTEKRNEYIHSIWASELDGDPFLVTNEGPKPIPTVEQLRKLAGDIKSLGNELNDSRVDGGSFAEALAATRPPK